MKSNFAFLGRYWSSLAEIGAAAEKQLYYDNNACVSKLGTFAELLTEEILISEKLTQYIDNTQFDRIDILTEKGILPLKITDILHKIRMERNEVEHDGGNVSSKEAEEIIYKAHRLAVWFMKKYGGAGFAGHRFVMPARGTKYSGRYVRSKTRGAGYGSDGKYYDVDKKKFHGKNPLKKAVITLGIIIFLLSISLNIYFIFFSKI